MVVSLLKKEKILHIIHLISLGIVSRLKSIKKARWVSILNYLVLEFFGICRDLIVTWQVFSHSKPWNKQIKISYDNKMLWIINIDNLIN
jgi:hypothetical protein